MPTPRSKCTLCGRPLLNTDDPLSGDCGGDCWGCIGKTEADLGWEPSVTFIAEEIESGLRLPNGNPAVALEGV